MNLSPKGKDRQPIDKEDKRDKSEWILKRLRDFLPGNMCWSVGVFILRMVRIVRGLSQDGQVPGIM